ncbi:MAG TPA: lipoyl(octanoyl) transferase LipB [Kofleriaceae bacterium]|nr:lipoyl(octanoyl) transferase LipB [Kofleriaceae bacterium]
MDAGADAAVDRDRDRDLAEVIDLGLLDYQAARERQLEVVAARQRGERRDALLLVEHPHVITVGRRQGALANLLRPGDVPVVEVERGGDVTYHGPGQVVAYPILALGEGERDLHRFLRNLEEAMIRTVAGFGIEGTREPGKTGMWVGGGKRKIASIGIACRKWVTFHGLALNVTTDLAYFARIQPCGFDAGIMTSMSAELGREVPLAPVKAALTDHLGATLGRRFIPA